MISNEAWRELVAALANQNAARVWPDEPRALRLTYEEIESAPNIEVTWDSDLEVVTIEVRP
jgi:hypothetical protein